MSSESKILCLATILALMPVADSQAAASDLATLFTTPQERQLINTNRYKSDDLKPSPAPVIIDESPVQQLLKEQVSVDYRISGISMSADGTPTVWINDQAYLDGDRLEDGSRIKVITGKELQVRITTPDGRQHYATGGETLSVSYMATIEN